MTMMIKRIVRISAALLVILAVTAGVLYLAGMRIVFYGGGGPRLQFVTPVQKQVEALERHREEQRRQARATPPPAAAGSVAPAAVTADPAPGRAGNVAAPDPAASAYWTAFRGPARDGHYQQRPVLTTWPANGPKLLWKQPVGGGYGSFAIAGGRAFTIEQRGPREVVGAYDVRTGRELWAEGWTALFSESMGGDGPRSTPAWADGVVYALGASGELRALEDATGRTIWRTNILEDAGAGNLQWGMAASPLVVDGTVVVLPGGRGGQSIAAYDRRTGRRAWAAQDDQQSYSSPMLATVGGVRQLLVLSATRLMGVTPDAGELLWEYPWKTDYDINASQPLAIGDNRVFVSTGYGAGAAVIELTRAERGFTVREVWRNIRMKNRFTSSLLHDGFVFGLDEGILACVDAATGDLKWKGGRYGHGQTVLASGHVFVLTESGELALVRATPDQHVELARVPALDGKTWNHPAISDGYLLIRNASEMAALDLR